MLTHARGVHGPPNHSSGRGRRRQPRRPPRARAPRQRRGLGIVWAGPGHSRGQKKRTEGVGALGREALLQRLIVELVSGIEPLTPSLRARPSPRSRESERYPRVRAQNVWASARATPFPSDLPSSRCDHHTERHTDAGESRRRGGGSGRALVLNGPPGSSRDSSRWPTGPPRRPIGEAGTFGPKDLCGYRFGRIRKMSSRIAAGLLDTSSMGRRAMA